LSVSRALLTLNPALLCEAKRALRLSPQTVHVWAFFLDAPAACLALCRQTLCRAEEARAERFVHAANRDHFIVAHGVLRQLLGRYTATPAPDIHFLIDTNGKPALEPRGGMASGVSFNMTHSHSRALIAVSDGRDIGIDLEKVKPDVRALAIARRYFCGAELAAIEGEASELQREAFFRYWVAKEAVLKGQGIGLRFPIDEFEVQFDARGASACIRTREPSRLASDWTIRMLPVEPGWAGALAVRGAKWTLQLENAPDPHAPGA
jgi:4'-phosphopantetheinyl transferase